MYVSTAWLEAGIEVELLIEWSRTERFSYSVKLRILCCLRRPEWGYWIKFGIRKGNNLDQG